MLDHDPSDDERDEDDDPRDEDGREDDADPQDLPLPPAFVLRVVGGRGDDPAFPAPLGRPEFLARITNREVLQKLFNHAFYAYGGDLQGTREFEDITQNAYIRALKTTGKDWPADEKKTTAWMKSLVRYAFLDLRRDQKRHENVESREDIEEIEGASEPGKKELVLQAIEIVHHVAANRPGGEDDLEMLASKVLDERPIREIAAERNMSEASVRQQMHRLKVAIREHWVEATGLVAVSFAILYLWIYPPEPIRIHVGASYRDHPPYGALPPVPTGHPTAPMLRDLAHGACAIEHFGSCLEYLDRARLLDPAGETDPQTIADRKNAEAAVREGRGESGR